MKFLLIIALFLFAQSLFTIAQSDSMQISFKNGTTESISVGKIKNIKFENITSVFELNSKFNLLNLSGNFPNPAFEHTNIEFNIDETGDVNIIIYDYNGIVIKNLKCENCSIGNNILKWDCKDNMNNIVQNGIYYYEVYFKNEIQLRKMIVIK